MALGIRTKVFFFTLLATLLTFLVAQGILTRPLEPAMSRDALATLQGRVPLVGIATALVLATLLAWQVGRWVAGMAEPLTLAARRLREGDLTAGPGRESPDLGELSVELGRLSQSLTKTMNELRVERDLQTNILEGMQEGVLLLDAEGRILLMNSALREMLLLRDEAIGSPFIFAVRNTELKELFDAARRKKTSTRELDLAGLKPRRLLVRAAAQGVQVLAVFVDVTEIRRLESLRRDFVANVSHELRTPVTSVLSAAETLRDAASKDPTSVPRFLDIIQRNAERLQRLIEDLLDLSRIESKEYRLRPEPVDLGALASQSVQSIRQRADEKKQRLAVTVPDGTKLTTDRRALEQVLTNLVENAVKYCPEGASITVTATAEDKKLRVAVEDTGAGIAPEHIPRLFERFYRVDAGRSRAVGGTGLGLSIVKHLVEAMGGTVGVESTVGKGSTFFAVLPREPVAPPDRESAARTT
ncbi:MAG: PAS domain-containing sensor histidine kinase [Myxococcales bacterium]|jgi:two-component system phosphate regulon sensor histidine kinase PhoR|nr:PAS domain-containing sensor histidine kinase [Myxococcales bacterium]